MTSPTKYLSVKDKGAFRDWPRGEMKKLREMSHASGYTKLCPVCKGHGGWNLQLNAYPLHLHKDTARNRHFFSHFRAHCMHCNGWGWTSPAETCPGHQWVPVRKTGNCLTVHRCTVCGKEWEIDSSD